MRSAALAAASPFAVSMSSTTRSIVSSRSCFASSTLVGSPMIERSTSRSALWSAACEGFDRRSTPALCSRSRSNSSTVTYSRSSSSASARVAFTATADVLWVCIARISATVSSIIPISSSRPFKWVPGSRRSRGKGSRGAGSGVLRDDVEHVVELVAVERVALLSEHRAQLGAVLGEEVGDLHRGRDVDLFERRQLLDELAGLVGVEPSKPVDVLDGAGELVAEVAVLVLGALRLDVHEDLLRLGDGDVLLVDLLFEDRHLSSAGRSCGRRG